MLRIYKGRQRLMLKIDSVREFAILTKSMLTYQFCECLCVSVTKNLKTKMVIMLKSARIIDIVLVAQREIVIEIEKE